MFRFILLHSFACLIVIATAQAVDFATVTSSGKRFTVCRVDLAKEHLQLFLKDSAGQPLKAFEAVDDMLAGKGERLVFAMNAGMYHGDFSPVGLCVINEQQVAPLRACPLKVYNGA